MTQEAAAVTPSAAATPAGAAAASSSDQSQHSTGSTGTGGSIGHGGGTPFFADAILDLDTAHDLAETPEVTSKQITSVPAATAATARQLDLPSLTNNNSNNNGSNNNSRSSSPQRGVVSEDADTNGQDKTSFTRITSLETTTTAPPPSRTPTSSRAMMAGGGGGGQNDNDDDDDEYTPTASISGGGHAHHRRGRRPAWPRDLSWAVAFLLLVPTSLIWPILVEEHDEDVSPLIHAPLSTGTAHALLWAAVLCFFGSRFLYRTASGPQGDDARHSICQALSGMAALSLAVYIVLMAAILLWLPRAKICVLIPLWYTVRDFYLVRRWRSAQQAGGSSSSRHAFFQALVSMALDILSRSLRRVAFFRVLSTVLMGQTCLLFVWRWAFLGALGSGSLWMVVAAAIGGKWATGTVARLLSLIASGGVANWFMEQAANLPPEPEPEQTPSNNGTDQEEEENGNGFGTTDNMPDAYRTVDASVYQTVLSMDDVIDDDDDDDDDDDGIVVNNSSSNDNMFLEAPSRREYNRRLEQQQQQRRARSTVKSLLQAGLTVSFGSVAQCGLVGGLAQFIWSQLRKVDAAQSAWAVARANAAAANAGARRNNNNNTTSTQSGFSTMAVGDSHSHGRGTTLMQKIWNRFHAMAREFVRSHSDLAMSHVAAYYKSYQRAARDVATLVDDTGVEPILHDDITTHMCASVGGALSGLVVIFTGYVLLEQREAKGASPETRAITDMQVAENMILAFVLCYTLIFTVMEPLRAAIKAVYVSFAQHPRSLSQVYPLIYHRLSRMSASNVR